MPRNTSLTPRNELVIHDNLSDSDIVLYYRTPTTTERNGYQNMAVSRRRNRVVLNQAGARLKYGLLVLTGFRDGDFVRDVDGHAEPYSSDPDSPRYLPAWKDEVAAGAADLVMLLAGHLFDASAEIEEAEDGASDNETAGEDVPGNLTETSPR